MRGMHRRRATRHALGVLFVVSGLATLSGCSGDGALPPMAETPRSAPLRIAFGSCADDDAPDHPVWAAINAAQPDAMIFLGDNVYADTPEFSANPSVEVMRAEYAKLAAAPGFQTLRANATVLATWDDHDYGLNDGGVEFTFKDQAANLFFDFWEYPPAHPARKRPGVYAEQRLNGGGIDVQVLLLDTRYFRDALVAAPRSLDCPIKNYAPSTGTVLGDAQWRWLEARFDEPADLRLVVSSTQVIPDEHCWEKWGNFPAERARLLKLLAERGQGRTLLLSGDRHLGELSAFELADGSRIVEATSSPMSAASGFGEGEPNRYRLGGDNLRTSQFGLLDVDAAGVSIELRDARGDVRLRERVEFAAQG